MQKDGMAYLDETDREYVWSLASLAKAKKNALALFTQQQQPPDWLDRFAIGFDGNDVSKKLMIDQGAGVVSSAIPFDGSAASGISRRTMRWPHLSDIGGDRQSLTSTRSLCSLTW